MVCVIVCVCMSERGLGRGEERWEDQGEGRREDGGSVFHLLFGWLCSLCLRPPCWATLFFVFNVDSSTSGLLPLHPCFNTDQPPKWWNEMMK